MNELKPCPVCGQVPEIGYACGEYFIVSEDEYCTGCGIDAFTEMHASEEAEIEACNRSVDDAKG